MASPIVLAQRAARRAPLVTFFVLAFALTWALLPLARKSIAVGLVALFGPAAAAAMTARLQGGQAPAELLARLGRWRVPVRWYLAAIVVPLAISALGIGIGYLAGFRGPISVQPISALTMVVFVLVIGEEIGWRGFALPNLLDRVGPWRASAIIGTLWGLWHTPLFFLPGMPQFGQPLLPFIGFTIALSVWLTFFAQRTENSLVIATLFHGSVNTLGLVNGAATPTVRGWVNGAAYGLAALLIGVVAWSRQRTR